MKKTFIFIAMVFGAINLYAQKRQPSTIHIIEILDFNTAYRTSENEAHDAGYIMKNASNSIKNAIVPFLGDMADNLHLKIKEHVVHDAPGSFDYDHPENNDVNKLKYTPLFLNKVLSDLECKNDIVVILYSGHGFSFAENKESRVSYPNLILNYKNSFSPYYSFRDILNKVYSKSPLMVLSIVSACQTEPNKTLAKLIKKENSEQMARNTFVYNFSGGTAGLDNPKQNRSLTSVETDRARELFFLPNYSDINDNILSVELISSSHGELTYINHRGGHFVRAFKFAISSLIKCNNNKAVNWQDIASLTDTKTKEYVNDANKDLPDNDKQKQTPQCFVFIKNKKGDVIKKYEKPLTVVNCEGNTNVNTPTPNDNPAVFSDYYAPYNRTPSYNFAIHLTKLANTYRESGQPDYAIEALSAALPVLKSNNNKYFEATAYENKAWAYLDKGDKQKAIDNFKIAMQKFDVIGCCGSAITIRAKLIQLKVKPEEIKIKCK